MNAGACLSLEDELAQEHERLGIGWKAEEIFHWVKPGPISITNVGVDFVMRFALAASIKPLSESVGRVWATAGK